MKSIELSGLSISPGLATGEAFVFHDIFERDLEAYKIEKHQVDDECARIDQAVLEALADLSQLAERIEADFESDLADIFRAHQEILRDVTLAEDLRREVEGKLVNAERAVQRVFEFWEQRFRSMDTEGSGRLGDDAVDLGRRLLRTLAGAHTHSLEKMPKGSILVARALLPSDATFFSRRTAAGIVTEFGSRGSHCALLTRAMGIPGICQVPNVLERISTGDQVLVDGLRGTVTIQPDEGTCEWFERQMERYCATQAEAKQHCHEVSMTLDGVEIPVMANIGNRRDAELAAENGADGVGLYRTEIIFLGRKMLPTEEQLITEISRTITPFEGKPIAIRILDIGGDKHLPYLRLPVEENPFLGRRGVRLLLRYPELLDVQLRTLLRLSREHNIQIVVPMVTISEDMKRVRAALEAAASDLNVPDIPPLGAMIETPAAALGVKGILEYADFLNVGTNDLTQYTMAAGRENAFVNEYFQDDHEVILRLLRIICEDAGQAPVGLCGELGGQSSATLGLLSAGVRFLSVAPPLVPSIKEAVRRAWATAQSRGP